MQNHDDLVRASLVEIPECIATWTMDMSGEIRARAAEEGADDLLSAADDAAAIAMRALGWHEKTGGVLRLGLNEEVLQTTTKYLVLTRYFPRCEYAHTVVIKKSGNAGFARIKMKLYADALRRKGGA